MRNYTMIILILLFTVPLNAQIKKMNSGEETETNPTQNTNPDAGKQLDAFIIGTGFGAGAVVSSNIVNSGAVIPTHFDMLFKIRHHRIGFGFGTDYYLTPENLTKLVFGNTSNVTKGYLMYDWMLFRYSPINIGFGVKLGGFSNSRDSTAIDSSASFASTGITAEFGSRKFSVFVRPELEYKSYGKGSLHKELSAIAIVGLRFKFMTDAGKARLEEKKNKRRRKK